MAWLLTTSGSVWPSGATLQQATHLAMQIRRRLHSQPLQPWRYRDFGSLVPLGTYTTVGNLMGHVGGNFWTEGVSERGMYQSLYKTHEIALHGYWKTALGSAARFPLGGHGHTVVA